MSCEEVLLMVGRAHAFHTTALQRPRVVQPCIRLQLPFVRCAASAWHSQPLIRPQQLRCSSMTGWHPLEQPLVWQGTTSDALKGRELPYALNPPWKVILLSDGSVTRHLQLMTNMEVKVECLEMKRLEESAEGLPPGVDQIPGPLLQRQVFLRRPDGEKAGSQPAEAGTPLVYAASWWNAAQAEHFLQQQEQPIWVSLQGTELRRDIHRVCYGNSAFLERALGVDGPFWGRQYVFWSGGKPLTVIYEVFSPKLEEYLGPVSGP